MWQCWQWCHPWGWSLVVAEVRVGLWASQDKRVRIADVHCSCTALPVDLQQTALAAELVFVPCSPLLFPLLCSYPRSLPTSCFPLSSLPLSHFSIISISLGRQAVERRVVSQDLQLWLSSVSAECHSLAEQASAKPHLSMQ